MLQLQGYNAQKVSFSKTIHVKQIGHAHLHLDAWNEDYIITLPALHIEGLIFGNPFVELGKTSYISSSSGFVSEIEYAGKGWMSGKKNSFNARLYRAGHEKDTLYSASGQWNESFTLSEGSKKGGNVIETFSHTQHKTTPLTVAPLDQQDPLEAHRAWKNVIEGIKKGDMDMVHKEKSKIEMAQREFRKREQQENREWQRAFFTRAKAEPIFEKLAKALPGEKLEADRTDGVWIFDTQKAQTAKPPYGQGNVSTTAA